MYRVRYSAEATKAISRLPLNLRQLIVAKIKTVAAAPGDHHPQVKALVGDFKGLFRLRVGKWRVIYAIDSERQIMSVVYVRKREGAYD
jgi:mRNA interferase RelE/StbE